MAGWVRNKNVAHRSHWTFEWQQQIYPHVMNRQKAEVFLTCLLYHILSLIAYTFLENREFIFIIILQFMMIANIWIRFGLQMVFVCLHITPSHYDHCANLSEDIELIKCLSYIYVAKTKHINPVVCRLENCRFHFQKYLCKCVWSRD